MDNDRILTLKRFAPWIALAIVVATAIVWFASTRGRNGELTAHGNVDLRQVELPFNASERVAEVLVEEGARVSKGQVLARLDTSRLEPQVAQAEAQAHAQEQVVERLRNGNRPQEIAQAKANVQSAQADAEQARIQYERIATLFEQSQGRAVSPQDRDQAKAAAEASAAKLEVAKKSLDLMQVGARKEDIAEAEARLRANQANLAFLQQQLHDAELLAPVDAIVRARLIEPGELASPQKSAFSLAIVDPKWVRAYVGETELGKVHPNMQAAVTVDSFPGRRFDGWVGFISPTAEFTPKTVQTEELRSSLVYEVRVFVKDPEDALRLGMPATVHFVSQTDARSAER
jgi:HlyD family secretion protein